jgi:hypothetical protein
MYVIVLFSCYWAARRGGKIEIEIVNAAGETPAWRHSSF